MNLYSPHDILDLGKYLGRYWFYSNELSFYVALRERSLEKARRIISALKNDVPVEDDVIILGEKRAPVKLAAKVTYYHALVNKGLPWEMDYELAKKEWGISREEHKMMVKSAMMNGDEIPTEVLQDYPDLNKEFDMSRRAKLKRYAVYFVLGRGPSPDIVFHKDVFIPSPLLNYLDGQTITLQPSYHAQEKVIREYYSKGVDVDPDTDLSKTITLKKDGIIEVGLKWDGNIVHILYREPFNDEWDIVYAIRYPEGYLKTFWLNRRDDIHETLNRHLYESNPKVWYKQIFPKFKQLYGG